MVHVHQYTCSKNNMSLSRFDCTNPFRQNEDTRIKTEMTRRVMGVPIHCFFEVPLAVIDLSNGDPKFASRLVKLNSSSLSVRN